MDPFEVAWRGVGVGGRIALDFANTLDWRLRERPVELLRAFDDLLRWARTAEVLDRGEARSVRVWAADHPRIAARALARAIEVREAIAPVFQALARGTIVPERPLAALEEAHREASAARSLRAEPGGAVWAWTQDEAPAERVAWAVALDAASLLTSPERERVRECGDAQCGWLFLDTSRNRSRCWCTMEGCGNRNKARTFYRRAAKGRSRKAKS